MLQVEYEQLWNVEDRSSRRLSSSEEEDTEEEAPGISSSPLQVNFGRKDKVIDQSLNIQEVGPVSLPPPARQESSGARTVLTLAKKEGLPPAPPARPAKSHARSSSLGWFSLYPVFHPLLLSPDLQAYRRGGTLPSLPSVPPRSSPFFRAQHSFEPPSSTTTSREEARDLLGRDTKEISAGLSLLPSQLIQLYTIPRFAEIHKYKESIALLSRTLAELGQEVGFFSFKISSSYSPDFR